MVHITLTPNGIFKEHKDIKMVRHNNTARWVIVHTDDIEDEQTLKQGRRRQ